MPHHHHQHDHPGRQAITADPVVYVTAAPNFAGPIAGYVTVDPNQGANRQAGSLQQQNSGGGGGSGPSFFDAGDSSVPAPVAAPVQAPAPAPASGSFSQNGSSGEIVGAPVQYTPSHRNPAGQAQPTHSANNAVVGTPVHQGNGHSSASAPGLVGAGTGNSQTAGADSAVSASPSSSSTLQSTDQSSGMSGGAKAGLAFGIIIIVGLIAGLAFFVYRRKKTQNEKHQKLENEKSGNNANNAPLTSHVSVRRAKAQAPRLSLRPMTEMFPDEKGQPQRPQQDSLSLGGNLAVPGGAGQRPRSPGANSSNLYGNNSEFSEKSDNDRGLENPFGDDADSQRQAQLPVLGPANTAEAPMPLSVKQPSGNGDRESSNLPPVAAAQGPPSGPGPNNVHRVQLDFKPSMEDELGLTAGQVVRMLHEYDDGWALCIRLDRSQQGVVPRSCLSKLPIKPRPAGPPPPHMRGPPPNGRPRGPPPQGRPMSPAGMPPGGGRMRSQSNGPNGGQPRPMSPGPFGSGQYGGPPADSRQRANSASGTSARRITPPGASPMNPNATSPTQGSGVPIRKPVPGQAM